MCFKNQYKPDYVSSPGETILEMLKERGMSQSELARRMGLPIETINEIIQGKREITSSMAQQLGYIFVTPASFWKNREKQYRLNKSNREKALNYSDQPTDKKIKII